VDFVCFSHRLVIEIDGGQHAIDIELDEIRTRYLEPQGFRVLRFWNNEVLENPEGVFARIGEVLQQRPPHPPGAPRRAPPSPARGEGI
jgi:very-short-patch-repair endonuclease